MLIPLFAVATRGPRHGRGSEKQAWISFSKTETHSLLALRRAGSLQRLHQRCQLLDLVREVGHAHLNRCRPLHALILMLMGGSRRSTGTEHRSHGGHPSLRPVLGSLPCHARGGASGALEASVLVREDAATDKLVELDGADNGQMRSAQQDDTAGAELVVPRQKEAQGPEDDERKEVERRELVFAESVTSSYSHVGSHQGVCLGS